MPLEVIKARHNEEINFHGRVMQGNWQEEFGIVLIGCLNITIRGLVAQGFLRYGLYAMNCERISVIDSDVSHNFDNPAADWLGDDRTQGYQDGWGGGIYFRNVRGGAVRGTSLGHQFNGIDLIGCQGIEVTDNPITPTSNWAVHLLESSGNILARNNCSYAVRRPTGDPRVTADSVAILLENQSHRNRIERNDCRYSGDGIFIRSQAPWRIPSDFNELIANDCSFSPNNAIEVIAAHGTKLIGNKANRSNYGMWLDLSQELELEKNDIEDNETEGLHILEGSFQKIAGNRFKRNPIGFRCIRSRIGFIPSSNIFEGNEINVQEEDSVIELPPASEQIIHGKRMVILSPMPNQRVDINSVCRISWEAQNIRGGGEFHLNYHLNGCDEPYWHHIAVVPANQTSYEWLIPEAPALGKTSLSIGYMLDGKWIFFEDVKIALVKEEGGWIGKLKKLNPCSKIGNM